MKFSQDAPVKIVIIGAGGTGSYTIPHLYRIAFASGRKSSIRIIVCDGDIVEKKNLVRQNFIFCDIGGNKAQVIAERYAGAFGMQVEYIPHYIESADELLELVTPDGYGNPRYERVIKSKVILIGAVDNNRSRQICHEVFKKSEDLIYIDAGNGESTGQVVCGVKQKGRVTYKPVCSLHPDILDPDPADKLPTEMSCAERAVSAPQSVTANLMASTAIVSFMYNLLVCGELKTRYVNFSAKQINMRATMVKPSKKQKGNGKMSLQRKMDAIANVFGAESGIKAFKRCGGKWFGTVDYAILFNNGERLWVGNSRSGKKFAELVDEDYETYNPAKVQETKDYALERLRKRASQDNAIAKKLGLKSYEVVSVELNTTGKGGYMGWYYVVLRIGKDTVNHVETGLKYDIQKHEIAETVKENYHIACGVKEEADYVFNGTGFSTKSPCYKLKSDMVFHKMLYSEVA